jgi:hypothetical protein
MRALKRHLITLGLALLATAAPMQAAAILVELNGGEAERTLFHYDDPDVALASYAAPDVNGCGGAMIGPNLLMTAAHCGRRYWATFIQYRDENDIDSEVFACRYLMKTFPETDLALHYCAPNADGMSPGDKYGYLDFDVLHTETGQFDYGSSLYWMRMTNAFGHLYSIWTHPIDLLFDGRKHQIYSRGQILRDDVAGWYAPNDLTYQAPDLYNPRCTNGLPGIDLPMGIESSVYGVKGASGSVTLSSITHRILLGPTSTAGQVESALERFRRSGRLVADYKRGQLSLADYLQHGYLNPDSGSSTCHTGATAVDVEYLARILNITRGELFYGWADEDGNGLFDLQEVIEDSFGENPKDWHWLGFESRRRNATWEPSPRARFNSVDPLQGIARLSTADESFEGYRKALQHRALVGIEPDATYTVAFRTRVLRRSAAFPLRVCLRGRCKRVDVFPGDWRTVVIRLKARSSLNGLVIQMLAGTELELADLSVIEAGAVMDFDTHPKRVAWRNGSARGLVVPSGRRTTQEEYDDVPDFAGRVKVIPGGTVYTLRNDALGIDGGRGYRVCFSAIADPGLVRAVGMVRVRETATDTTLAQQGFSLGGSWNEVCTPSFLVDGDSATLEFGSKSSLFGSGSYLVDDIRIERALLARFPGLDPKL